MAEPSPNSPLNRRRNKTKSKKSPKSTDSDRLKWSQSVPSDDPFFLFPDGGEGGMISLEEIDESEYGIVGEGFDFGELSKAKKRKRGSGDVGGEVSEDAASKDEKRKKKIKRKRKRKDKKAVENGESENDRSNENEGEAVKINDNHDETLLLDENDIHAWNELRLHPLLLRSIRQLGFKEPTPIQKACIPAAAHQGKDVIGAAETGSGKTLAFGLPILQRLLEERDKESTSPKAVKGGPLRALIVTPTRELALQVSDHLKKAAKSLFIQVVPIVGGMSSEKQERLLRRKPEIIVGTPGRLWQLMSEGNEHLVELHSLSFFVLDEADRMIENGHFHELQSIIDKLPTATSFTEQNSQLCDTFPTLQRKKRQTFVFSATISLSENFRRKLKRGSSSSKQSSANGLSSIEALSERAGMRPDAAIVDLTSAVIMAHKLEESFIECKDDDKDTYLYYVLSLHGQGRSIIFCTSIDALRRISNILRILGISALTLHSQMQQRARLKAIDRFRGNENGVLVATDVAARGLDIPGVRTVVHYQLPHSTEVYIHRSGRTARASSDGCSIALISSSDKTKFFSLCQSLSKESLRQFPVDDAYMTEVFRRLSLAVKIDQIMHQNTKANAKKSWFLRHAESLGLDAEDSGSEEDRVNESKQKKSVSLQLKKLQQELGDRLKQPLRPKTFSHRFLAGSGVSPLLQQQLEELSKNSVMANSKDKKGGLVVIGHHRSEAIQALRDSGKEVFVNGDKEREKRKLAVTLKRKKREEKISARDKLKRKKKDNKMD